MSNVAVIGYDNILTQESDGFSTISITGSSSDIGFELENAYDWNTYDFWKPNVAGESQIRYLNNNSSNVAKPAPTVDYVAFYAHSFSDDLSGTIAKVWSGSGGATSVSEPITFTNSKPKLVTFSPVSNDEFFIKLYAMENRVLRSQEFDNAAWTKTDVSITANAGEDINGISTADTITSTVAGGSVTQGIGTFASGNVTASCYFKKSGTNDSVELTQQLAGGTGIGLGVVYNFDSDTLTAVNLTGDLTFGRTDEGNGWFRVWINYTDTGSNTTGSIRIEPTDSGAQAIGDQVLAWQAQWEHSPAVNKPVLTTSAADTSFFTGQVGVIMLGKRLELPLNMSAPFTPPQFAYDHMITNTESDTGQFIGRSIRRMGSKFSLNLPDLLTPDFVKNDWDVFARHAYKYPFFFAWDTVNQPDDVVYAWTDGNVPAPSYSNQSFMKIGLNCRGLTE